jgi:oligopeptide/dipeptide ABC transporter ATP-binding protein
VPLPALEGNLSETPPSVPLVEVRDLSTEFRVGRTLFSRRNQVQRAVDCASFDIMPGQVVGLVGESGSGKTTLARTIIRLQPATGGSVRLAGTELLGMRASSFRPFRRRMQMIFQDPYGSLNPRKRVGDIIGEGLSVHRLHLASERRQVVEEMLERVGLQPDAINRFPHEFSGGQRQRIGIARALVVGPEFVIADEPVSALDVSIQAQILNLLKDLQRQFNLAVLVISHDLGVVHFISDHVMVMYLGRIVESAPTHELYRRPKHPYTRALLAAVPVADPRRRREQMPLTGDIPNPMNPPSGCTFRTRCTFALPECAAQPPPLRRVGDKHLAACIRDDVR